MIATKMNLLDGFIGTDRRQFVVPIYQRKYKWTIEQCSRLIDDMLRASSKKLEHFTGAIVYKERLGGSPRVADLVDGQQRITTVMLMVKALEIIGSSKKAVDKDYLYVFNSTTCWLYADKNDPEKGLKVKPSKNDETVFRLIMQAKTLKELEDDPLIVKDKEDLLFANFKAIHARFLDEISKGKNIRYDLFEGLLKLVIVEMSLETGDDAQEIFESINSLGMKLSNADLIRNYLLMSNANQDSLYRNHWEPMQDNLIGEDNMEDFVNDYLLMRKCYPINYADIYKEYVSYADELYKGTDVDKEALIQDLHSVAEIYQPFLRNSSSYSASTNMLMQELRDMDQSTAYPFLMRVFLDQKSGLIDEETLDKVINLIITYLVRRTICGIATHSLRGFMLNLYNRIFKIEANKKRYYESVFAFFQTLQTNDAMPTKTLLEEKLATAPLYNNIKFVTYLLFRIENGRFPHPYSEFAATNSPSVEHIMPQTLTPDWESILGENYEEIHQTYLGTLGNLSLSSRPKNSNMGNEPFEAKKQILLTDGSKFNVLNKDVIASDKFTLNEIVAREKRLAKIVLSKYDLESVDTGGIRFEESEAYTCSLETNMVYGGATPLAISLAGVEQSTDSFAKIVVFVTKYLNSRFPEKIRELALGNYNPWNSDDKAYLHLSKGEGDPDQSVNEDICVNTTMNAVYSIQFCALLMKECGIEPEQLTIYLKKDSIKKENLFAKIDRVKTIRKALSELAEDGKVVYDPEKLPKNDDWIKFQTVALNETFKYDGKPTKWDGELYPMIANLEYWVVKHVIVITVKSFKGDQALIEKLQGLVAKYSLNVETKRSDFWHLKLYHIDFKAILDSEDKVENLKTQLIPILDEIDSLMASLGGDLQ